MTKEELKQYRSLKIECEILLKRINALEKSRQCVEHGFVKGSNTYFPYEPKSFHVSGYNIITDEKKIYRLEQLKIKLENKKTECEEELFRIQDYINKIPDSSLRCILNLAFIEGVTYEEIGKRLHMDRSTIGKRIVDYFNKVS